MCQGKKPIKSVTEKIECSAVTLGSEGKVPNRTLSAASACRLNLLDALIMGIGAGDVEIAHEILVIQIAVCSTYFSK